MPNVLDISVRFLDPLPLFHGQRDGGEPEWPPSPLRLFQAIVDAATSRWRGTAFIEYAKPALDWLQRLHPSEIITPPHFAGTPFRIAVPNNDWDSPARMWAKGNEPVKQHRPIDLKTMKTVQPIRLAGTNYDDNALHYLYSLQNGHSPHIDILKQAIRSITHLGWGIDMAIGNADVITEEQESRLPGHRWHSSSAGGIPLRMPKVGTLDELTRKHVDFLNRFPDGGFRPVPPLRVFDIVRYRCQNEPLQRPSRIFDLRNTDGSRFSYPHAKLIHISGMVRHLAIEAMKKAPPRDVAEDWVEAYVAGHAAGKASEHRQLSYLPLPSVGHEHTDPGIRRVMITAPIGDDHLLDYVARRLGGMALQPLGNEFGGQGSPILVPVKHDNIARLYADSAKVWHSFTPVILPGHDDHNPDKRRALIEKALRQAGIDQPCEFDVSAFSRFRKAYSAHKYDRDKRPQGYIRPDYLLSQTAVHLTLRFQDDVPGPIAIGAGRHCGLGLFAPAD